MKLGLVGDVGPIGPSETGPDKGRVSFITKRKMVAKIKRLASNGSLPSYISNSITDLDIQRRNKSILDTLKECNFMIEVAKS